MPQTGEQRRNPRTGEVVEWTGNGWKPVPSTPTPVSGSETSDPWQARIDALKKYATELATGTGTARSDVADYGKQELGAFGSGLNPINMVKGAVKTVLHPVDTASGLVDMGSALMEGNPRAVGSILSMIAAPKVYGTALGGTNKLATALSEPGKAQNAGGAVAGALGAKAVGLSPWLGMGVGRAAAPSIIGGPASDVAGATSWLMDKLGMGSGESGPAAATLTPEQLADLLRQGVDPSTINPGPAPTITRNAPEVPPTTGSAGPIAQAKPFLNAQQVLQAQKLLQQGVSPDEIVLRLTR